MRSVCGCTPASSAATEMTYNPLLLVPSATSHPQVRSRGVLGGLGQGFDGLALGGRELLGHGHLGRDKEVTGALADRHAAALDAERASRLGAGGDLQCHDASVERRHLDLGPECRFGERDRHGEEQIPALAVKQIVGCDVDDHIQVARRTAVPTGTAAALQADALTIVDTGGDAHLDLTGTALDTAALACRAR